MRRRDSDVHTTVLFAEGILSPAPRGRLQRSPGQRARGIGGSLIVPWRGTSIRARWWALTKPFRLQSIILPPQGGAPLALGYDDVGPSARQLHLSFPANVGISCRLKRQRKAVSLHAPCCGFLY